jgi:hypothetical protein
MAVMYVRRGKEDRTRLVTYYIFSVFSEAGRVTNGAVAKGCFGISNACEKRRAGVGA